MVFYLGAYFSMLAPFMEYKLKLSKEVRKGETKLDFQNLSILKSFLKRCYLTNDNIGFQEDNINFVLKYIYQAKDIGLGFKD